MRESNDRSDSEVTNLCSLGVVDLELSLCPDVFGREDAHYKDVAGFQPLRELTLLLPDTNIGKDGFHDVVVENLIGSSTWRSRHVSPSDVIAPRRRESRVPGHEGTLHRIRGFMATSVYWTTVGISIRLSGLLPGVQN